MLRLVLKTHGNSGYLEKICLHNLLKPSFMALLRKWSCRGPTLGHGPHLYCAKNSLRVLARAASLYCSFDASFSAWVQVLTHISVKNSADSSVSRSKAAKFPTFESILDSYEPLMSKRARGLVVETVSHTTSGNCISGCIALSTGLTMHLSIHSPEAP